MDKIDSTKVKKVYSGKPGCMCGCRGSYRYSSRVPLAEIEVARGYAAKLTEVNDRQVSKVTSIMNIIIEHHPETIDQGGEYLYAELDGRAYCVYFTI